MHHGWNTGRQLLLHAVRSPLAKRMTGQNQTLRQQAITQLFAHHPDLDESAGPLTLALHISAVQQPALDADTTSLIPLIREALADLGDWGISAPLPAIRPDHPIRPRTATLHTRLTAAQRGGETGNPEQRPKAALSGRLTP